jgi:hypothetical protein
MGVGYGKKPIRVVSSMIHSITVTNTSITSQGDTGFDNSYEIKFSHNGGGCGPVNDFLILFKETNPPWKYITWQWIGTGTTSCWSFNSSVSDGGNLLTYNASTTNGDKNSVNDAIFGSFNSWELTKYQTHGRTYACDNNADNFFHVSYHNGDPKRFFMKRRRNMNGSLSGIYHSRNCTTSAAGIGTSIIKDIVLFI